MLLSGEAGIRQIAAHGGATGTPRHRTAHALALFHYSPQHTDSAFYPIIGQMERAARLTHDETLRKRGSINLMPCWRRPRPPNKTPHFLPRCSRSPMMGGYPVLELTPQARADKERLKR